MINILDNDEKMEREIKKLRTRHIGGIGKRYEFVDVIVDGKEKTYKLSFKLVNVFFDRVEEIGDF